MGKEKPGFLTAKSVSNRIKSKGLQKLRWFCQMCQKQCRDENGFKCHITSESHHRQILLFNENSNHFLGNFTRVFMKGYLDVLKRQFGGKRTQANVVYQEYIKDKEHVHMNSTKFTTLTGFINCLHKMGICRVDQTDKGWFIEYIAKDPEQEHMDRKKRRLNKTLAEDDEQFFDLIEKHLCKKSKMETESEGSSKPIELIKNEDEKITFNFIKPEPKLEVKQISNIQIDENTPSIELPLETDDKLEYILSTDDIKQQHQHKEPKSRTDHHKKTITTSQRESLKPSTSTSKKPSQKKFSTLEQIKLEQELDKERRNRARYWLHEGIVVKLVDRNLPKELQNRNVHVRQVENRYTAIVKTIDVEEGASSKKMRVQQEHVMTVVPKIGEKVLVVNGAYRECRGKLLRVDRKKFTGDIELISGIHSGMKLVDISFDDFSKMFDQN